MASKNPTGPAVLILGGSILLVASLVVAVVMIVRPVAPQRCPPATTAHLTRCCPHGQSELDGHCIGQAASCPAPLTLIDGSCVAIQQVEPINPAELILGPTDWESTGTVASRVVAVREPFALDRFEVTEHAWSRCVSANHCAHRSSSELGLAVRSISFDAARAYCLWMGGDLPTVDQWLVAAAGPKGVRYPWGSTGAVCRRADWGRFAGPCAQHAQTPELVGLFELDQSASRIVGLAGGVSEWCRGDRDMPTLCGGSWSSRRAAELRVWNVRTTLEHAHDEVGLRCSYHRK